ncbi:MAG: putative DNA binding domain-containing protein [Kiritimatiellae bacterium]|nr:putative DNA binding domain-containing protein [Kiritimatiellia bacterium]
MKQGKLQELIRQGEGECVEFKSTFQNEAIETVVAFANSEGGSLVLGVDNNGATVGTTFGRETTATILNRIASATEPTVVPEVNLLDLNGETVCVITVSEYPLKPVSTRGRCYRRVGNANSQMPPAEIAQMHMRSTGTSWDALPATGKTVADIDLEAVAAYIDLSTRTGRKRYAANSDPVEVLRKLELVNGDQATWAAILLFGKRPQSPLIQATVHCGRFREKIHIMDDRLIEGSALYQINETMDFIQKHINVRFEITGEKPQRDTIWDYPLDALREAVTNAICHRDYASSSDIQIKVFDDSIRIWNPGVLAYDLSFEQLRKGTYSSHPRNKLIAQIFYDLEIIERYGSGIGRIDNACKEAGLPLPKIENQGGGFTVIFSKAATATPLGEEPSIQSPTQSPTQLSDPVLMVLTCLVDGPKSSGELRESLSIRHRPTFRQNYLHPVLERGFAEFTIPNKPSSSLQKYRITKEGMRALEISHRET